ncbi:hypothetical protein [Vibrio cholerae]|uniref:hypothetical protein n=3 Tax=Vibrio cholerae TaxID=666 RepID=UPI00053C5928|nr:hypothetical protein [Vibrio cholerae]
MHNKAAGSVNYISGPGYRYEDFEPMIDSIKQHFDSILNELNIFTPEGKPVEIQLGLHVTNPDKISATAERISKDEAKYQVNMSAGLAYHVWLVSRAFASEVDYFPWLKKVKIIDKSLSKIGRKNILADYAYYLISYCIILHEISHVVLGHCDYLADSMRFDTLDEFDDNPNTFTKAELKVRYAFEAEADRQAGEFAASFFDLSLGKTGLGGHIRFPSRAQVHEFFIYSTSAVFALIQQLTTRNNGIHPEPNKRQYILTSSYLKYLEDYHPLEYHAQKDRLIQVMLKAGRDFGITGADDPLTVAHTAIDLISVDGIKKDIDIKSKQHLFK